MARPIILSIHPADSAAGVILRDTVQITFDRQIDQHTVSTGGIFIEGPDNDRWSGPDQAYWDNPETVEEEEILTSPGYHGVVKGTFSFIKVGGEAVAEVSTITFPALLGAADGDYVVVYDAAGTAWAIALDTTGIAAQEPGLGTVYEAIPAGFKTYLDVSALTTAIEIAAAVTTAFNLLVGFTSVAVIEDNEDGSIAVTQANAGVCTNPVVHTFDDGADGSISFIVDTAGTDEIFDTTGDEDLWTDQVIFTPDQPFASATVYKVWVVGEESTTDEILGGVSTRTVYDTDRAAVAGTGDAFFSGSYNGIAPDVFHVRLEEAGDANEDLRVTWWKASDPIDIHTVWTKMSSQLLVNGVYVRFEGTFVALDEFTVVVIPPQFMEDTYSWEFTTGSGMIKSIPSTVVGSVEAVGEISTVEGVSSFRVISVTPAENASNLKPEDCMIIVVEFSDTIDEATVTDETVEIWSEPVNGIFEGNDILYEGQLAKILSVDGNLLTIQIG